jgi:mono/diheme cytochrome c family protein
LARELKGLIAGLIAGLAVVGAAYGVSAVATHGPATAAKTQAKSSTQKTGASVPASQFAASGQALYSSMACVGCHGTQAQGADIGPTLHHLGDSDTKVARNIKNGFSGRMPAYKDKLSSTQINSLVAYIQSLE